MLRSLLLLVHDFLKPSVLFLQGNGFGLPAILDEMSCDGISVLLSISDHLIVQDGFLRRVDLSKRRFALLDQVRLMLELEDVG